MWAQTDWSLSRIGWLLVAPVQSFCRRQINSAVTKSGCSRLKRSKSLIAFWLTPLSPEQGGLRIAISFSVTSGSARWRNEKKTSFVSRMTDCRFGGLECSGCSSWVSRSCKVGSELLIVVFILPESNLMISFRWIFKAQSHIKSIIKHNCSAESCLWMHPCQRSIIRCLCVSQGFRPLRRTLLFHLLLKHTHRLSIHLHWKPRTKLSCCPLTLAFFFSETFEYRQVFWWGTQSASR